MKTVNKDKVVIETSHGLVVIDRVPVPIYRIGDIEFTEYDMRNLQLEVAKGNISDEAATELGIVDAIGVKFEFRPDGRLVNMAKGYDQLSRYTLDLLSISRKNNS